MQPTAVIKRDIEFYRGEIERWAWVSGRYPPESEYRYKERRRAAMAVMFALENYASRLEF